MAVQAPMSRRYALSMRDKEIKHCQLWREHCYIAKVKSKYRRNGEEGTYVSGGQKSMNGLAQILEVNWYTAAAWVRNYEGEGPDAFLPNKTHTYSQEVKR